MAGNEKSVKRANNTRAQQAKNRQKDAEDQAGKPPRVGTGVWARANGLWKEGDTEGPAPKS